MIKKCEQDGYTISNCVLQDTHLKVTEEALKSKRVVKFLDSQQKEVQSHSIMHAWVHSCSNEVDEYNYTSNIMHVTVIMHDHAEIDHWVRSPMQYSRGVATILSMGCSRAVLTRSAVNIFVTMQKSHPRIPEVN